MSSSSFCYIEITNIQFKILFCFSIFWVFSFILRYADQKTRPSSQIVIWKWVLATS